MEVVVKNEEEKVYIQIKEEVDNDNNETASQEDPSLQHEVECKLEVGPEVLQPRDMVFLPSDWDEFEDAAESKPETLMDAAPPPFLPEEPEFWFAVIEWQFILSNITKDAMKFYYVIGLLDCDCAKKLKDIITKPPAKNKYETLKKQLIELLRNEPGDNKPSQFLRYLKNLAVNGGSNSTNSVRSTAIDNVKQEPLETIKSHTNYSDISRSVSINPEIEIFKNTQASDVTKLYSCTTCGKRFKFKKSLITHLRLRICNKERLKAAVKKLPYTCDICKRQFSMKFLLDKHKQTHGEKLHTCSICSRQCSSEYTLRKHLQSHIIYTCEICNKQFVTRQKFLRHKRIHLAEKPYVCDICTWQFSQKCHLISHIRRRHKERALKPNEQTCSTNNPVIKSNCEICGKQCYLKSTLENHLLKVHFGKRRREKKKKEKFSCEICHKQFSSKHKVLRHQSVHTGEKPYFCDICKKQFTQQGHLNAHLRTGHTGDIVAREVYTCDICQRQFSDKRYLVKHIPIHAEKLFNCDICKKGFTIASALVRHKRNHTGDKPLSCDTCEKKFIYKRDLDIHMRIHTGEKPFSCDICVKKFATKSAIAIHNMRNHYVGNSFSCDICNKKFAFKSDFASHVLIHTGEKPFSCNICGNRFVSKSKLATHMRIHTGEKLFHCDYCEKKFTMKSALIIHIRIHTGEKPFICGICGKTCTVKSALVSHMRIHTAANPFNGGISGDKDNLDTRIRSNTGYSDYKPFSCDICQKTFTVKYNLVSHMRSHTAEKPFSCGMCNKQFTMRVGMKKHVLAVHANYKPWACNVCDKKFAVKFNLLRHTQTHKGEMMENLTKTVQIK